MRTATAKVNVSYFAIPFGLGYLALRLWLIKNRYIMVDETEHLHAAWCMFKGLRLYKDFFEHHGPVFYWLLQAVIYPFYKDPIAALFAGRLLMMVLWVAILLLGLCLQKKKLDFSEKIVFLLLLCSYTTFARFTLEIRPDVLATFLMCLVFTLTIHDSGRWKTVWIGALVVAGLLTSPKFLFPVGGFLVGDLYVSIVGKKESPVSLLRRSLLFLAGGSAVAFFVGSYFYLHGSFADFYHWFFVFNRHLMLGTYDSWSYFKGSITENPIFWGLAIIGLFQTRASLPMTTALIAALAGLFFVKPAPLGQYFVYLGPLLAWFACFPLNQLIDSLKKTPDNIYILGPIATGLAFAFFLQAHEGHLTNHDRLESIRAVMKYTAPQDKILSFWAGDAVFRPHADFYCWLCPDIEETLGFSFINKRLLAILASSECRGVIWDEHFLKDHLNIARFILTNYKQTSCHRLYLHK